MNLLEGHPEFTKVLINRARRIASSHGCRMLKPTGRDAWGLGMFRVVDADGKVVVGEGFTMTPKEVAKHFGEEL